MFGERAFGSVYAHGDALEARHAGCEMRLFERACRMKDYLTIQGAACMRVGWERECVWMRESWCVFRSKLAPKGRGRVK
jgi:hypothetical protein